MPKNPYYSGPKSDHFDGTYFFNPEGISPRGFVDLLKWNLLEHKNTWPDKAPSPHPKAKPDVALPQDAMRLTMIGHASFLIQTGGLNILTDPVWSDRVSPFKSVGPIRRNEAGIDFSHLPPIDLVLLTHNHYDHMDIETLKRVHHKFDPLLITPLGNDTIIKKDIPNMRIKVGDWGDVIEHQSTKIHFEPCHHWSARGARDRRMALWSAFVIETMAGKIYHIGDTGFHAGINYKDAADKHGSFRAAILPIGAYEPRWFMKGQHQNPFEAVEGFQLCNADFAAGHHWGTFRLTNEARHHPVEHLSEALEQAEIDKTRFRPMAPGEVWDIPKV